MSLKRIVLHGELAKHIPGGVFECEFHTAREAASALELNFPGFFKLIADKYLHIIPKNTNGLGMDQIMSWKIGVNELHIMPAMEGSGGGGDGGGNRGLKAILGLALIAVAIVGTGGFASLASSGGASLGGAVFGNTFGITGQQLAQLGVALLMSAFAQPPPKQPDRVENVIFTGPLTTSNEGDVLPYVAGRRIIVGGVVINTELIVDNSQ